MGPAEVPLFCFSEETVPEADEGEDSRDMDTPNEGEQTGIATQVGPELMEGAQALLGLCYEIGIGLEGAEADGVVDMDDGHLRLTEHLA